MGVYMHGPGWSINRWYDLDLWAADFQDNMHTAFSRVPSPKRGLCIVSSHGNNQSWTVMGFFYGNKLVDQGVKGFPPKEFGRQLNNLLLM